MRKAYRIVGSSTIKPENLPEGFEIRERLVGDILGTKEYVFHEVKDGSLVIYRQGVPNSNYKLDWEEVQRLAGFLVEMVAGKKRRDIEEQGSRCPGTPHRGHSSGDWSCWMDRK